MFAANCVSCRRLDLCSFMRREIVRITIHAHWMLVEQLQLPLPLRSDGYAPSRELFFDLVNFSFVGAIATCCTPSSSSQRAHTHNQLKSLGWTVPSVEFLANLTRLTRMNAKFTAGNPQRRWPEAFLVFESTGKTIILFSRKGDSEARRKSEFPMIWCR